MRTRFVFGFALLTLMLPARATGWSQEASRSWVQSEVIPHPVGIPLTGRDPRCVLAIWSDCLPDEDPKHASKLLLFDSEGDALAVKTVLSSHDLHDRLVMLTPLIDGWGVAKGFVEPHPQDRKDPCLFWFNPLTGSAGSIIARNTYDETLSGTRLHYLTEASPSRTDDSQWGTTAWSLSLLDGTLRKCVVQLRDVTKIDPSSFVGIDRRDRIVWLQPDTGTVIDLGGLPAAARPWSSSDKNGFWGNCIREAGPGFRDGMYLRCGNTVYFQPKGLDWRVVAQNIPHVKTFGGRPPTLSVAYLGNARFAIAKTVATNVAVSPEIQKLHTGAPGQSVTMLLDGFTGRLLDESEPVLYDHDPPLKIPNRWIAAENQQLPLWMTPADAQRAQRRGVTARMMEASGVDIHDRMKIWFSCDGHSAIAFPCAKFDEPLSEDARVAIANLKSQRVLAFRTQDDWKIQRITRVAWLSLCSEKSLSECVRTLGRGCGNNNDFLLGAGGLYDIEPD